jgi:hypothetical protein
VRIRAGGDQRWSSLPRPPVDDSLQNGGSDNFRLADKPGVIACVACYKGKWFNSE